MTRTRVNEALQACAKIIREQVYVKEARRSERAQLVAGESPMPHLLWMIEEAIAFPEEKTEKAMRWLGFVQGALWARGWITIDDAKRQSMPPGEEFAA